MADQPMTIAYMLQAYPSLTMTFIYREVLALERRGFNVLTFSVWQPAVSSLSQESRHLVDSTYYLFPTSWFRLLWRHLYFLLTRPAKYVGTALFVLTRPGEGWRKRLRTLGHFGQAVAVAKEMQERGVHHVHAHFSHNAASIALMLSRLLGISFSFTAHNILFTDQILLREKIREARFIAAISEFTRRFIIGLVPGEDYGGKIHIVHCGLSPRDFAPPDVKPLDVLIHPDVPIRNDVPLLLFVAQLAERKGAPFLVEACRILAERGVAFRCTIVGGGPQKALLEQWVTQYGLQNVVELTGSLFQEHVKAYLNRADVFVLPCMQTASGDMDGIPVSLMEAMAMEIATVSTSVSGIPELIEHGHSGLLVNEQDAEGLADALQRLIEDAALRERLGKNGRQKVLREFDVDKSAEQLATLFERYVKAKT
jgi:colanic acid/amylovoran biosynthesis glycosyltransferase